MFLVSTLQTYRFLQVELLLAVVYGIPFPWAAVTEKCPEEAIHGVQEAGHLLWNCAILCKFQEFN